jgi:hypothetical protein
MISIARVINLRDALNSPLVFVAHKLLRSVFAPPLRTLRLYALLLLDSLCRLRPAANKNAVLVLRLDAVGDFFIWMQSGAVDISRYARASGERVILVANRAWANYAQETGLWDEVLEVDTVRLMRNPGYRMSLLVRIRQLGARRLIQPRAARVFLQEDAITRVSGAAERIGNAGTLINITPRLRDKGNRYYSRVIPVDEGERTHELVRNDEFVLALTGHHATRFALENTFAGTSPRPTIAIALGAGQVGRIWPTEKLAGLVRHLAEKHPSFRIVLLGSPADQYIADRLKNLTGLDLDDRVGKTALGDYVAAIGSSALVICNDSSAYHVAMALGRKVVCFLGGGHYGWFAPYPASLAGANRARVLNVPMECYWCNWTCRYPRAEGGALHCVASISVEAAIAAVEALLAPPNR